MSTLPQILLAEDSEKDIELTLEAFQENKLSNEVVVVRDGQEALDYLYCQGEFKHRKKGNPCVIFLDLKMPKVDGLDVLQKIKKDTYLKRIPVVVLTSSKMESDLIKSYDYGANAYVVKPVDFNAFVEAVKQLGAFWGVLNVPPVQ